MYFRDKSIIQAIAFVDHTLSIKLTIEHCGKKNSPRDFHLQGYLYFDNRQDYSTTSPGITCTRVTSNTSVEKGSISAPAPVSP